MLNYSSEEGSNQNPKFSNLDESCLINTINGNKVAVRFRKRIEKDPAFKEKFLIVFPGLRALFQELNTKIERDSEAFEQIRDKFSEEDIDFILIKSDGSFPYESDNIDVLIRPEKLRDVAQLLKKAGYSEIIQIREPHKFLFRKKDAFEELPIHIHTRVEWEGTQFVDSDDLFNRRQTSESNGGFSVPSPEDCILITTAHFFFENHEIKLADLLKMESCIRANSIDWSYTIDHAKKLHWSDAFALSMLLANKVYNDLYGRSLLHQKVIAEMMQASHGHINLFQRVLQANGSKPIPFKIPYTFGAFFLLQRIAQDSSILPTGRLSQISWIASDIARRRVR